MGRTTNTNDDNTAAKVAASAAEATEGVNCTEGSNTEIAQLREQMNTMLDLYRDAQEQIKVQTDVINQLKAAIDDNNQRTMGILPEDVVEREKRMRERVEVLVTRNPLDPSVDVPYIDPHTGKTCKIQRGVKTVVSRAVYEVLEHSMRMDEYSTIIANEKAKEFEEATGKLNSEGTT